MSEIRRIWRIATEGPTWRPDDLSGMGAARDPGRWNSLGFPVVYASSSIALACLETLVHITGDLPLPLVRWLVAIEIPAEQWQLRTTLMEGAPAGWNSEPAQASSKGWGERWLVSQSSLIAEVPSVIVPEEGNLLINPLHSSCSELKATVVRRWTYDSRLI